MEGADGQQGGDGGNVGAAIDEAVEEKVAEMGAGQEGAVGDLRDTLIVDVNGMFVLPLNMHYVQIFLIE